LITAVIDDDFVCFNDGGGNGWKKMIGCNCNRIDVAPTINVIFVFGVYGIERIETKVVIVDGCWTNCDIFHL